MSATSAEQERPVTLAQWLYYWKIDLPLLLALLGCGAISVFLLYSASDQSMGMVFNQSMRFGIGLAAMVAVAQVPPDWYRTAAPWAYGGGLLLLVLVLCFGDTANGATSWLVVGPLRFQPSEIMKIAVPLAAAAWLHERVLPPSWAALGITALLVAVPVVLIEMQPDLGTALLVLAAGALVAYLAGLRWRLMILLLLIMVAAAPLVWFNLQDYQQERVLTFLNPGRDPAGAGYHIIQSKIAIGSGGLFGKGWLQGTQSHLNFLPESETDFLFAVLAEEMGFLGVLALCCLYAFLIARALQIAWNSQDTFQRLLAGSLGLTFFVYVFVNIGMVIGILPVVGVPLPLLSFGGTSMVVLLIGFGILMSIQTHKKLLTP